jgi:hypothetical protein
MVTISESLKRLKWVHLSVESEELSVCESEFLWPHHPHPSLEIPVLGPRLKMMKADGSSRLWLGHKLSGAL